MTGIRRMDHFTVITDRLAQTQSFYEALGLTPGPRPDFRFPGLWLYVEDRAVLHVIEVTALPAARRGVIDHMAFYGDDITATLEGLLERGVAYRLIRLPRPFSTWQVFIEDPNGAEVEIDFDAEQTVAAHLKEAAVERLAGGARAATLAQGQTN